MKNYRILIISLLLLIFMVSAVSAADVNSTDDLEITEEISVNEDVVAYSDAIEVESDDVLEVSYNEELIGDIPFVPNIPDIDLNFDPVDNKGDNASDTPFDSDMNLDIDPVDNSHDRVVANNMTMVYGDGSKFAVTYYDYQGNPVYCLPLMQLWVIKYGTDEYVGDYEADTDENGVAEYDLNLPVGKYTIGTIDIDGENEYFYVLTILESNETCNGSDVSDINGSGVNNTNGSDVSDINGSGVNNTNGSDVSDINGSGVNNTNGSVTNIRPEKTTEGKANGSDTKTTKTIVSIKKVKPKLSAKKKVTFKAKVKVKKFTITLKSSKKALKKVKVTLRVKGKTYRAKTNAKGKATFKITKLTKKGKYTAKIKFAGNKNFKAATKSVKITIK